MTVKSLAQAIASCTACGLCRTRVNTVPGEGPPDAAIMLIGEAPGSDEDRSGMPFVGRAGRILDAALHEAGIDRSRVFITNVVKCRPPENRRPARQEIDACMPFLRAQIEAVAPERICLLGNVPAQAVLGRQGVTSLHGQVFDGRFLITFHPAAVLRNRKLMGTFVSDLRVLKKE